MHLLPPPAGFWIPLVHGSKEDCSLLYFSCCHAQIQCINQGHCDTHQRQGRHGNVTFSLRTIQHILSKHPHWLEGRKDVLAHFDIRPLGSQWGMSGSWHRRDGGPRPPSPVKRIFFWWGVKERDLHASLLDHHLCILSKKLFLNNSQ